MLYASMELHLCFMSMKVLTRTDFWSFSWEEDFAVEWLSTRPSLTAMPEARPTLVARMDGQTHWKEKDICPQTLQSAISPPGLKLSSAIAMAVSIRVTEGLQFFIEERDFISEVGSSLGLTLNGLSKDIQILDMRHKLSSQEAPQVELPHTCGQIMLEHSLWVPTQWSQSQIPAFSSLLKLLKPTRITFRQLFKICSN